MYKKGKYTVFVNSPTAYKNFHDWFIEYKNEIPSLIKSVDIYGDEKIVKKLTTPCRECIIQATCFKLVQGKGCYIASIKKACMPLFKRVNGCRSYIKLYKVNYNKQHIYFGL